ncbi:pyridoxal-phosphate dependent enzyme [Saccharopolyspora shandongensis]|uniref:pyridoxal-phosphate dependent enzyme n=1 Tax=Saccharopolyspora shandongensis TaxID=418495 RepID=UPI0033D3F4BE
MARLFGFCARVYVPANTVAARIETIEREGAVVTVVDGDYDDAVRRSAEDESDRCLVVSGTSSSGGEQIARALIEGYSTIFWEIDDFFRDHSANGPDAVIVPVGVGTLAAASVRHYRRAEADTGVLLVGVEPLAANCVLESLRSALLRFRHCRGGDLLGIREAGERAAVWDGGAVEDAESQRNVLGGRLGQRHQKP